MTRMLTACACIWVALHSHASLALAGDADDTWKAAVASVAITPKQPMWMAGYAARNKPSEGKVQDLFAKALAIEDPAGTRLVIVTMDLIGIPRPLRDKLEHAVAKRFQLPPEGLLLNASHTHCGPELRASKASLYGLSPDRIAECQSYLGTLQDQIVELVGSALDSLAPARLSTTHGRAGFAMNRRLPAGAGIQNRPYPDGPVDHDVPVLRVENDHEELVGVVFGYACHNTTLGFYQFCGDYAGYAQEYLEAAHPGTTALFVTGCGGDQNPQPRRTLELAKQHGRALANGVEAALLGPSKPISGALRLALRETELEFADPPSREQLVVQSQSNDKYEKRRAVALLEELEESGGIRTTYPYLVQMIRFGNDLTLVALAGEVVVDYSLRFKLELRGSGMVWIAGYSNDVFGYVPSLRVLQEGGYEGGGAMRYTTLPGPFAPSVEKRVVETVHSLAEQTAPDGDDLFIALPATEKDGFTVGIEGPACDRNGNLFAVNFGNQGTIGIVTPEGKSSVFIVLPNDSVGNGIRFDGRGVMFVADYVNHNIFSVQPDSKKLEVFAHDDRMNQPNDLAIGPDGTLYASDPNWKESTGQLWRIDRDGSVTRLAADMGTTNGIEVSPDGKTLYVNESVQRNIWAFDITPEGRLSNKRLIKRFDDHGFDGMRCDVDGNLYVTRYGKGTVAKLRPDGVVLEEIGVLGARPSNICFGGSDGRTAYVTEVENRRIVRFRVDKPGLSWSRWRR